MAQPSSTRMQGYGIEEVPSSSTPTTSGQVSSLHGVCHMHPLSPPALTIGPTMAIVQNGGQHGTHRDEHHHRPSSSSFCMPAFSVPQSTGAFHQQLHASSMMGYVPMDSRFIDPNFQNMNDQGQHVPPMLSSSTRIQKPTAVSMANCAAGYQESNAPMLAKKPHDPQQLDLSSYEFGHPQVEASNVPVSKVCHEQCPVAHGGPAPEMCSQENTVVVREARSGKGKLEQLLSDGRRLVKFTNGSVKEILTDGTINIVFANGDAKRTFPNGVVEYYYCSVDTWQTTHPNGAEVFYFSSGQKEAHHPHGGKEILFPDGIVRLVDNNG